MEINETGQVSQNKMSLQNVRKCSTFGTLRLAQLTRYSVALLIFAAALTASLALRRLVAPNPFLLFWPAVGLSAWFGSFRAGILVTFLTLFSVVYFFRTPHYDAPLSPENIVRFAIFVAMSIVVSLLFEVRQRTYAALEQQIKEQTQLAEALRMNNERFRLALKGSAVSVFNQDTELRYTWLHNARGQFKLEEVRGKRDIDIIQNAEEARRVEQFKRRVLESGVGMRGEINLHLDGIERCYEMTIEPLRDTDGRIVGITGVALDLTERKQMEATEREQRILGEALRDSAMLLNRSLNLADVLEQILAVVGRVVPHDAADVMLFEDGKARIVGVHGYENAAPFNPDSDLMLSVTDNLILQQMIKTGEPLLLPNARIYPEWTSRFQAQNVRSYAGVPIKLDESVIGFLNLTSNNPSFFTPVHSERLKAFAPHAAVAISNAQLHEKATALAVLEERHRLARELHDAISQKLFTSSLLAEAVVELARNSIEEAAPHLETLRQLNRSTLAEMRVLLWELRPEQAVKTSLEHRLAQLTEAVKGTLFVVTRFDLASPCVLPSEVQMALYRIAQEAINNVIKHAAASTLTVELWMKAGSAGLFVEDDGTGFDPTTQSVGLGKESMRERAESIGAALTIDSSAGNGTRVTVKWTCEKGSGEAG